MPNRTPAAAISPNHQVRMRPGRDRSWVGGFAGSLIGRPFTPSFRTRRLSEGRPPWARAPGMTSIGGALGRAREVLAERRLGGGKPGDRHAERRARDVVEPDPMAESDRRRIATMLAADAELELGAHLAAALGRDLDQFADAVLVDGHERIDRQNSLGRIGAEEARRVVAANAERRLGEVVRAVGEELGGLRDLARLERRARQLDHGADLIAELPIA